MKALKLAECDCEHVQDFEQYYRNGIIGLPGDYLGQSPDVLVPANVQAIINQEGGVVALNLYSKGEPSAGPLTNFPWSQIKAKAKFGKPMLGTVRFGDSYLYLWDWARRESIKGLRFGGLQWWIPDNSGIFRDVMKKSGDPNPRKSALIYWDVLNPDYSKYPTARKELEEGLRVGVPISAKCGLYLAKNNPHILVSYKYKTVGHLDPRTDRVILSKPYKYFEEILKHHFPSYVTIS